MDLLTSLRYTAGRKKKIFITWKMGGYMTYYAPFIYLRFPFPFSALIPFALYCFWLYFPFIFSFTLIMSSGNAFLTIHYNIYMYTYSWDLFDAGRLRIAGTESITRLWLPDNWFDFCFTFCFMSRKDKTNKDQDFPGLFLFRYKHLFFSSVIFIYSSSHIVVLYTEYIYCLNSWTVLLFLLNIIIETIWTT